MRVFVAGATETIEWQLVPRLVAAGHEVHRMTRSESKHAMLYELGRSGGRRRARELEVEEADAEARSAMSESSKLPTRQVRQGTVTPPLPLRPVVWLAALRPDGRGPIGAAQVTKVKEVLLAPRAIFIAPRSWNPPT